MHVSKLLLVNPENFKKIRNCRGNPCVLTGEDRGEEDVVGEGDEAALPERVEDAVLVSKPLPLLGQLLLIQPRESTQSTRLNTEIKGLICILSTSKPFHGHTHPYYLHPYPGDLSQPLDLIRKVLQRSVLAHPK